MKELRKKAWTGRQLKRDTPVWWSVFKKQATEFCLTTGLHGYKYMAQEHRSKFERIFWAVVVLVSMGSAIVTMQMAYNYYTAHPTLTVIESTHYGIWNFPFPAVTVCNANRVSLKLAKELVETLKLPTNVSKDFVLQEMKLLLALLRPDIFDHDITKNLSRLQDIFDYNGLSIPTVVTSVSQSCSGLIKICKWQDNPVQCSKIIRQSYSRDGICCSFHYITLQAALHKKIKFKRVTSCGYQTGLTLIVDPETEDYFATTIAAYGVKIMLHAPYDYPDYNAENVLVGLNVQAFLSVAPEVTQPTPQIRDLDIQTRECIFSDEGHMVGFNNSAEKNWTFVRYSYLNCMAKCRASVIGKKCGCIPYYIPQNELRVCNLKDVDCLREYASWYDTTWPGTDMKNETLRSAINSKITPCGCVPDCNLYRYPMESSQGILDANVYYNGEDFVRIAGNNTSVHDKSVVHVYFNDLVSIQYRRDVYYNWYNLFASFGGLLGLFVGFSLMSVFELIYFFVVRFTTDVYTNIRKINGQKFHK